VKNAKDRGSNPGSDKKNLRSAEEARRKTPSFEYLTDRGLTEGWLSPYEPEDTISKLVAGIIQFAGFREPGGGRASPKGDMRPP